jgi:hypothetical protein
MGHQLTITEQPGYLHFRVTGENTPQTVRAYLAEVYAACAERGCSAILMEEDLAGPGLPMLDIYQIVETGGLRSRPLVKQIAFVDLRQGDRPGNARFAETVAINRGLNLRSFRTVEDAVAWLSGSETP